MFPLRIRKHQLGRIEAIRHQTPSTILLRPPILDADLGDERRRAFAPFREIGRERFPLVLALGDMVPQRGEKFASELLLDVQKDAEFLVVLPDG